VKCSLFDVQRAALLGTCLVVTSPGGVIAQQPAVSDKLDEVMVTGSRLISNGNDAPTPVTVVNLQELSATKPASVFEQLSELPAFNGSGGAVGTPTIGILATGNTGVSALNLRGLGSLRALVLFDGHRVPPTTPDGLVDINLMPQMLMQRVDVVTGGASAVYGSDAISGVMNFVIDRKFNGIKADVQRGISSRGDDGSFQLGIAAGTSLFGGRGHIEASLQRIEDNGIPYFLSRPAVNNWTMQGGPQNDGTFIPYHLVQGVTSTNYSYGGLIAFDPSGTYNNYNFTQNGVLSPFVTGSTSGLNAGSQIGGDGAVNRIIALKGATRLDQFFTRFDYDLTDSVHAYASAAASLDYNSAGSNPGIDFGFNFSACNAFLAVQYQQAMGCTSANMANPPVFVMSKLPDPLLNLLKTTVTSSFLRNAYFLAGLEGKFGANYHWDTSYSYSQTMQDTRADGIDEDPHLFAALDAVVNPANGQIVCNITLTNPGLQPGCVPLNLFGPNSESKAALNYTFGRVERWSTNKLHGVEGNLRGDMFNDWAGPVGVALSGAFRHLTFEMNSNSYNVPVDCTGIQYNCVQGTTTTWGNTIAPLPQVQQNTGEAAFEVDMPLIKDVSLIKALNLDSAARYARYSNNGNGVATSINATTWKTGLVWTVNDQLTLRWARSRDIRAPNLWDLYNPVATTATSFGSTDYFTQPPDTRGQGGQQTGGNPYLRPEVGLTTTLGLVYRPTANFNVAVDGYRIDLKDAITVVNGADQNIQEACYASGGSSPYCQLQVRALGNFTDRSLANYVTKWYQQGINIASIRTWGVDVESNYKTAITSHAISLRALVSYKPHIIYSQSSLPTIDQAGAATYGGYGGLWANPVWRSELFGSYNVTPSLAVNVSERWRSHMFLQGDRTLAEVGGVAAVAYTNASVSYDLPWTRAKLNVYLNVENLFDQSPPHAPTPGFAIGDDVVGTYFNFGMRARL